MKVNDKYFVRIDRKLDQRLVDRAIFEAHLEYVKRMASENELYAGTFHGTDGGMIVFRAKDFSDASARCKMDPIVMEGYYGYDLYEWDLLLTS